MAICEAQNQTDAEKEDRQTIQRLIPPLLHVVLEKGEKVEVEALVSRLSIRVIGRDDIGSLKVILKSITAKLNDLTKNIEHQTWNDTNQYDEGINHRDWKLSITRNFSIMTETDFLFKLS